MPAHRFTLMIAGETMYGIACSSEAELDAFLASKASLTTSPPTPAIPTPAIEEPRSPGRPSHDQRIAAAVQILGRQLRGLSSTERARKVLRQIAETCEESSDIPGRSTVLRFLASQNSSHKSSQKYPRGKITPQRRK